MKKHKILNTLLEPNLVRAVTALIIAIFCLVVFFSGSMYQSFLPVEYNSNSSIDTYYDARTRFITCSTGKLYYTGYDYKKNDKIAGHYYYSLDKDICTIYLLSRDFVGGDNAAPTLENISFKGVLKKGDENRKQLLDSMAGDLDWSYAGISQHSSDVIISQYNYNMTKYIFIIVMFILSLGLSIFFWTKAYKKI